MTGVALERLGILVTQGSLGTRVANDRIVDTSSGDRIGTLVGMLRPIAVKACLMGAMTVELRRALDEAMAGVEHVE